MKKIIFCIPGNNFSSRFVRCWTDLISTFYENDIQWDFNVHYHPEVHMARNELLGGFKNSRSDIKPWGGGRPYDYIMWIDSDIIFKVTDFYQLLKQDKDIVSGVYYRLSGSTINDLPINFACAKKDGSHLTLMDIDGKNDLIEVKGNGMGFMLIKNGVFEKVGYPWFEPDKIEYEKNGIKMKSFYSEDIKFQLKANNKGFKSYIDPKVILGHEKNVVLI